MRKFCRQNFLSHQVRFPLIILVKFVTLMSESSTNRRIKTTVSRVRSLRKQCTFDLNAAYRYLIDSGFIQVSKAYITELSRARYGRHKNRFVTVPTELDRNSTEISLINAALVTGLYPKLMMIDPSNSQMRTISNNQVVSFHPSSINFGKKAADFGVNYLCYFTIMLVQLCLGYHI